MNAIQPFERLEACFGDLTDPGVVGRCDHILLGQRKGDEKSSAIEAEFAVIPHVAFNLLKQHPFQANLNRKRFRAALDDALLFELLSQF